MGSYAVGLSGAGTTAENSSRKTIAVGVHEGLDPFGRVRAYDQTGVMMAIEPPHDLGCVVAAGIGLFLARETDDASGVTLLELGQRILHVEERGDFNSGPLDPGVEAGGKFDDLGVIVK